MEHMKKEKAYDVASVNSMRQPELYDPSKESRWTRLGLSLESFKRAPGTTGGQVVVGDHNAEDLERIRADAPMLQQKMKPRHLQMIAVGGSIGTGLFVGSGSALNAGGPAGVLIAWILIGAMLINVTQALGEMSILYPVSGGFYTLAVRFLDPSFAFAMGWNYVFQWAVYWTKDVHIAAWITIFWIVILIASVFGTLGFAEEEFWSSCLKLLVVVMFIFIGIICICGAGPDGGMYDTYLGGRHWQDPGPFAHGFKGVCAVFVTAGTELVGLAASETPNPRETMPSAVKGTFWRIVFHYYLYHLTYHHRLLVPYDEPRLLGGGGAAASPFVIALDNARIKGLNHRLRPKIFAYVDKSSRPLFSSSHTAFGPLAYVNVGTSGDLVFKWLLALSGLSTLFTWLAVCLCQTFDRGAPFQAFGGVYGSWFGTILVCLVLIAQFYVDRPNHPWRSLRVSSVCISVRNDAVFSCCCSIYLAAPVMILFWVIGYFASDIDLDSGRKSWLTVEEMRLYRAERRLAPFHIRLYRMLFTH
ncbi:amino acid permease-domain-containing protein [Infundibulicybe gibba]|nr:amino acid permease-domain-containing protein [Infundibulicybe gibba]